MVSGRFKRIRQIVGVLFVLIVVHARGQFNLPDLLPGEPVEDRHYLFPVNPGQPGLLAGTMGELRSTHFHAGIDIRTNNMIGAPVRAAKGGYIARAMVSSFGYGKVLFLKHPNGQTTVYAHLDSFKGALGEYVRNVQYTEQSFPVDVSFTPDQFPLKSGDTIAYSGNTGGSSGPHLHFEIRDSSNEALNPLTFGFSEIKDTYPPIAQRVALKTLDIDSRINDRFGRFEFTLYKVGNYYTSATPIQAHGRIGVEVLAYDKMDLSTFRCGINHINLMIDSQQVFSQVIDKINFLESRGILDLMDYKTLKTSGARFNKLYADDGTQLDYHTALKRGELSVGSKDRLLEIVLTDTYGNASRVRFTVKASPVTREPSLMSSMTKPYTQEIFENTLTVAVKPCPGIVNDTLTLFSKREKIKIIPTYHHPNQNVYLFDLRRLMPDSILSCQGIIRFENQDVIPSGTDYKYYSDWADLKFSAQSLYDTLYLHLSRSLYNGREVFTIGDSTVPLSSSLEVTLKPQGKYIHDGKTSAYRVNGAPVLLGGQWHNGRVSFKTQELGNFALLRDTLAPVIRRIALTGTTARFRVRDDLSGIAGFEATINGNWVLMNYDYKTGLLTSEQRDKTLWKGDFQLKVTDQAGNERLFHQNIL